MMELVLASASPRRRQLLEQSGYKFITSYVKVSEIPQENLNLQEQIEDLARQKAQALVESYKSLKKHGILLVSADTVVVLDDQILGKPKTSQEATEVLGQLSGQKHRVITGVCLWQTEPEKVVTFHETSEVTFRDLSKDEIQAYVDTGDCMDKAGSYGIQGEAGKFVAKVDGSFDNIVGFPTERFAQVLKENNWNVARR